MKKKYLSFLAVVVSVLMLVACGKREETTTQQAEVNDLPVLSVTQTDGSEVFLRGLDGKLILIFFNPDCDHCQNEAKAIAENKKYFEDYQLYFISSDSIQNVKKFAEDYQLTDSNFHFSHGEGMAVYNAVGPLPSVPAIFLFRDRKRIKDFMGETQIEELKKYL